VNENDVRLTIRAFPHEPTSAVFATLHEGGHALYDQGLPRALHGTLLADGPSSGMHESQARLWENHVGRSRAFWEHYLPKLAQIFPDALAGSDARSVQRAIAVVAPSLNRVAADEATYNLHILVRYELELALLGGNLSAAELPGAWNERYAQYLGVTPPNARSGCLQDVHWALGSFGYFPSYVLGSVIAAQLWESLRAQVEGVEAQIARGEFAGLFDWLRENVHGYGAKLTVKELIKQASGQPLGASALLRYLENKYLESGS